MGTGAVSFKNRRLHSVFFSGRYAHRLQSYLLPCVPFGAEKMNFIYATTTIRMLKLWESSAALKLRTFSTFQYSELQSSACKGS